jgi:hypothetical protein
MPSTNALIGLCLCGGGTKMGIDDIIERMRACKILHELREFYQHMTRDEEIGYDDFSFNDLVRIYLGYMNAFARLEPPRRSAVHSESSNDGRSTESPSAG